MSEDKKEPEKKKEETASATTVPMVKRLSRTTSGDSNEKDAIYDTTQINTLAFKNNNPVAQAVADMLDKTNDPSIRNTIKKAATDVMQPELGSPKELGKKLEQQKQESDKSSTEEKKD